MRYGRDPSDVERAERWMMGVGAVLSAILGAALVLVASLKAAGQ